MAVLEKTGGTYETQNQTSFVCAAVADDADGGFAYVDMGGRNRGLPKQQARKQSFGTSRKKQPSRNCRLNHRKQQASRSFKRADGTAVGNRNTGGHGRADPQVTEEPLPTLEPEAAYQAGVFVLVTENTRVFSDVDETADEADGELATTAALSAPQTSGWKKSGRTA